jgi:hypothetical protein
MSNEQIQELTDKLARLATETKETTEKLQRVLREKHSTIVAGDRVQCTKGDHEGQKGTVIRTTKVFAHVRVDGYPESFKLASIKKRKTSLRKI